MTYFNAITDPTVKFEDGINLYAKISIAIFSSFIATMFHPSYFGVKEN